MPTSRGLNNLFLLILDTHIVSIPCPASLAGSSSASVLPLRMRTFPSQQWVQGSPGSTHKDTYNVSMSRTRMSKSQGIQWACWLIWIYLDLHQNQQPRSKARDRCCLAKREKPVPWSAVLLLQTSLSRQLRDLFFWMRVCWDKTIEAFKHPSSCGLETYPSKSFGEKRSAKASV